MLPICLEIIVGNSMPSQKVPFVFVRTRGFGLDRTVSEQEFFKYCVIKSRVKHPESVQFCGSIQILVFDRIVTTRRLIPKKKHFVTTLICGEGLCLEGV